MTVRAAVARITLTAILLSPSVALAQGCNKDREAKNMSCAVGQVWDEKAAACVPVSS